MIRRHDCGNTKISKDMLESCSFKKREIIEVIMHYSSY